MKTREDAERVLELFAEPDRFKKATDHGVRTLAVCATGSHEHYFWPWLMFSCVLIAATNYVLGLGLGHLAGFYIGGPLSLACLWFFYRLFRS